MASTYLTKSNSSTASTNQYKGTFSFWVKLGNGGYLFSQGDNTSGGSAIERHLFQIQTNGTMSGGYRGSGGSPDIDMSVSGKYRDCNGWYHVVYAYDTSLSTASERVRIYVNNVEQTVSWSGSASAVPQNTVFPLNKTSYSVPLYIGSSFSDGGFFSGSMSHLNYVDGQQLTPSTFGETDSTTGEWKIKTSPSVTYGTNGFFILKDGNSVTDQSGNGNNFTVGGGTLTKTEDCPSNVFATLNAIDNYYASATYSNGNLSITTDTSKYAPSYSTLGVSSGKYYAECKMTAGSSARIGIISRLPQDTGATSSPGNDAYSVGYYSVSGDYYKGSNATSYGNSYTNGDIIGIAMDLDNNRLFFSKNGTWQNSGDPTSSTGAITIPTSYSGFYHFAVSDQHDGENAGFTWNFGNGYFGTTAVSSAGTNASGLGIFEYDVPSGYTALCTKGLNL